GDRGRCRPAGDGTRDAPSARSPMHRGCFSAIGAKSLAEGLDAGIGPLQWSRSTSDATSTFDTVSDAVTHSRPYDPSIGLERSRIVSFELPPLPYAKDALVPH